MILTPLQRNIAIGIGILMLVVITVMMTLLLSRQSNGTGSDVPGNDTQSVPPVVDFVQLATQARQDCDRLSADPTDPGRQAAGVVDAQMAVGEAVSRCEDAVQRNAGNATLLYELGRAYWVSGRAQEGFLKFAEAAELNYPAAYKAIGDAYMLEQGLPSGETYSPEKALHYYELAAQAGHPLGPDAVTEATVQIRKDTFDPSQFQNAGFMQRLYDGRFDANQFPISLAYYMQGVVSALDSNESIFIDQTCKPLVSKLGLTALNIVQAASYLQTGIEAASSQNDDVLTILIMGVAQHYTRDYVKDMGYRDGITLFNTDIYGCKSKVTEKILSNIMLTTRQS